MSEDVHHSDELYGLWPRRGSCGFCGGSNPDRQPNPNLNLNLNPEPKAKAKAEAEAKPKPKANPKAKP